MWQPESIHRGAALLCQSGDPLKQQLQPVSGESCCFVCGTGGALPLFWQVAMTSTRQNPRNDPRALHVVQARLRGLQLLWLLWPSGHANPHFKF